MATTKCNQLKSAKDLYENLELALWHKLSDSKKHKAYYLFTVAFSDGWWLKDNVSMVRKAVLNHSLNLIWNRQNPRDKDDDNINIYFLQDEQGQYSIVLVLDTFSEGESHEILDIIPVKRNDYEMTQIYPKPAKPIVKKLLKNSW